MKVHVCKGRNDCLLCCQNFALVRSNLLNRTFEINVEFRNMNDLTLSFLLLFGSEKQTFDVNSKISNLTIEPLVVLMSS